MNGKIQFSLYNHHLSPYPPPVVVFSGQRASDSASATHFLTPVLLNSLSINMRVEVRTTTSSAGSSASNTQTENLSRKTKNVPVQFLGSVSGRGVFQSVLTKPFRLWNNIEEILAEFIPEWSPGQRSCIITNLLRFLELKVIMDEYEPNKLLAPTQLVAHAWHVLILETEMYRDVTFAIQDFHARPRRMIHHALLSKPEKKGFEERLERTQRLFYSYYQSQMPSDLTNIDGGKEPNLTGKEAKRVWQRSGSSIVTTRDESSSHEKENAGKFRETEIKDDDEEEDDDDHRWYNVWFPTCGCLNIGEVFCCKEDAKGPSDDIYAVKEDVSLLTPDGELEE